MTAHDTQLNQQHPVYDELAREMGGSPLDSPGLFSWSWGGNESFDDFEARAKAHAEPAALDAPAPTAREVAQKK